MDIKIYDNDDLIEMRNSFRDTFTSKTIQGFIFTKPHGYAGDFEIIDKIYRTEISGNPRYKNWDEYAQNHDAAIAVRNRKSYFKNFLADKINKERQRIICFKWCKWNK